jgi:LEA14-like dessication related protein
MKTLKPIIITLIIAGAIYGSVVLYGQFILLKKITYKLKKYYFQKLTLTDASLVVTLEITNTTGLDFIIKSGSFDVSMNGIQIGTITTGGSILPKNSPATVDLTINFNPTEVFQDSVTALLSNPGNTTFTVVGSISLLSNFIILNKLPVNESMTLAQIMGN